MVCPFCEAEMQHGRLTGEGRSKVVWERDGEKLGFLDKIGGIGAVDAKYTFSKFIIEADYCPKCRKMIFSTNIAK